MIIALVIIIVIIIVTTIIKMIITITVITMIITEINYMLNILSLFIFQHQKYDVMSLKVLPLEKKFTQHIQLIMISSIKNSRDFRPCWCMLKHLHFLQKLIRRSVIAADDPREITFCFYVFPLQSNYIFNAIRFSDSFPAAQVNSDIAILFIAIGLFSCRC